MPFNRKGFCGLTLISLILATIAFTTSVDMKVGFGQSEASLYINPPLVSKTYIDVGTTFEVNVTITDVVDLYGFDLNFTWENSLISLAQVDFTTTLNKIWGSGHWFRVNNESGAGYYSLAATSTTDSFNSTGPTPLCRLTFSVLDPQSNPVRNCSIHFETDKLSDSQLNPQPISHTVIDGTYIFEATVQITPSLTAKCSSDVGTTFNLSVTVRDIIDLYSFDLNVTWFSALLTFSNCYYNATLDAVWGSGKWLLAANETGLGYYRLAASSTTDSFNTTQSQTMFTLEFLVEESAQPDESSIHFAAHTLSDGLTNPIAHFVEDGTYKFGNTLTITTIGSGSVSKSPDQAAYAYGTNVTLTASVSVGWTFDNWGGDASGAANPTTINMTHNMAVTATFFQNVYNLTVSTVGSGSVTLNNTGPDYHYGDAVQLTAVPAIGWSFQNWSGNLVGSVNPATLIVTSNMTVNATFIEGGYTLTISTVGSGYVTLISNGTVVTLTAFANVGWTFASWSGDVNSTVNPTTISMTHNMAITATFALNTLTVNIVGAGSVSKSPNQAAYAYGTNVTLTATANIGWAFANWSGDASGTSNPITVNMTGNKVVNATFTQIIYSLTVSTVGGGSVTLNNIGPYHYGDVAQLTATAIVGWSFQYWSGSLSGPTNPATLIITGNMAVTATFMPGAYTLTVNILGGGSVSKNPSQISYAYNTSVTLTASASVGWTFANWSGDASGTSNPITVNMTGNKVVNATFTQIIYTLTISTVGSGSVTPNNIGPYHYGDVVQLTAVPAIGWSFQYWSGGLGGSTNPATRLMTGNVAVTATFIAGGYTLTATAGSGGSVSKSPDYAAYALGTNVIVTAYTNVGWTFGGWVGDVLGDVNPITISMFSNMTVNAVFVQNVYTLTVTTVGSGSVTLNNTGPYYYGDVVQLTAVPAIGWSFQYWSGGLGGSTNPATRLMTGNVAVTATFIQGGGYSLAVSTVGSGSVTLNNTGPYHYGDVVQLTAVPAIGWSFQYWSGGISGSANPATLSITGNVAVTATFIQNSYALTVNTIGGGSVSKSPDQTSYQYGTSVTLTASANVGWLFAGWSGDASGMASPFVLNMTSNKSVTATFTQTAYTLTMITVGQGNVLPGNGSYPSGANVGIQAINAAGWQFTSWSGGASGSSNTTIVMNSNVTVTATFTQILNTYTLSISVDGNGSVALNKTGPYSYGDVVQLTATANASWSFQSWSGSLTGSSNPATLTMTGNFSVTAHFTQQQMLQMNPESKTCQIYGENFTVAINLANAVNVKNFTFEIHYNTTLLDYVNVTWNAWGTGTIYVDENAGIITGVTAGTPFSGTQPLITIKFQAAFQHLEHAFTGTIFIQRANLSYTTGPILGYEREGLNQINVGPDFAYTFSPIQGDVNNNGTVDIFDLRLVAVYFNAKQGDPNWTKASAYDLNGDGKIDILDAGLVAGNFGYLYVP